MKSTFQIVVIGIFVVFLLAGVAAFALFRGNGTSQLPMLTVWGTLPQRELFLFSQDDTLKASGVKIQYVQKDSATFETEFVNALASGQGPDLVILPHDLVYKDKNKLVLITFNSYPERQFKDTFTQSGEVFLTPEGTYGLPILVDPLIMYWNRSLFSSKGIAAPPKYWDEFYTLAPKFNERNDAGNIKRTIVALGEDINITNFKELLSALIMQAGNPITRIGTTGNAESTLSDNLGFDSSPTEAALRFYTQFSNPVSPTYSWNKSLPESQDAFVQETLGVYFGLASELPTIRARNPNLDFDVAPIPQIRDNKENQTFGRVYALSIPKNSPNAQAAFAVAKILSNAPAMSLLQTFLDIPPARRDLLSQAPKDAYKSVFYTGAIMSRAWIDPSPSETLSVFETMVESVISGKERISEAVSRANQQIELLLRTLR